jgi:hypothetical protein
MFFWYIWLYVLFALVKFCKLCIVIFKFIYSYFSVDSVFIVLFYVVCVYKMCTVLLPPGVNPNAVNRYIITCRKLQYMQIKFMLMAKRHLISIVLYVISIVHNYHSIPNTPH